jgi:hypothetical protein
VNHDGHAAAPKGPAPRRQIRRQRNVSAEPDDHVGVDVVEHRTGLSDRPPHPQRQPHQVTRRLAGQRDRCDQLEVVAAFGNEPGLESTLRTERGDPHIRVKRGQGVGHGHCGFDVPRGAAAGEEDRDAHP